jgi:hypothetical protein
MWIQGSYIKMAAFTTSVQKISPIWWKTAPIPPKNTIKKFKKRVTILKKALLPNL